MLSHFFFYIMICFYELSTTVHPDGIPFAPVVQSFMDAALVNVPVPETPSTQLFVQLVADMSVARQVMAERL